MSIEDKALKALISKENKSEVVSLLKKWKLDDSGSGSLKVLAGILIKMIEHNKTSHELLARNDLKLGINKKAFDLAGYVGCLSRDPNLGKDKNMPKVKDHIRAIKKHIDTLEPYSDGIKKPEQQRAKKSKRRRKAGHSKPSIH